MYRPMFTKWMHKVKRPLQKKAKKKKMMSDDFEVGKWDGDFRHAQLFEPKYTDEELSVCDLFLAWLHNYVKLRMQIAEVDKMID